MKFDSRSQLALMIQDALGQTGGEGQRERGRGRDGELLSEGGRRNRRSFPSLRFTFRKKTQKTKDMKRT